MKALSLKQPWAWLVSEGIKDIENRKWKTAYRGRLLIHASKSWDQEGYKFILDNVEYRQRSFIPIKENCELGYLIGTVEMVDCVDRHPSKWFFGPWGFVFKEALEINTPIKYRGELGLFNVPDGIVKAILEDNYV
jgi:hypothetical protein